MSQRRAVVLSVLLGFGSLLAAEKKTTPVHFTVFALRPIEQVVFLPKAETQPVSVKFYPTARSAEFSYAGEMPVSFSDSRSGEVVAVANIPPEVTKALLIFVPVPSSHEHAGPRYQIHVLDDGTVRHRPGGVAFINLSGLNLVGKLGSRAIALGPGLSSTFNIDAPAELSLETRQGDRHFRSYSQNIELGTGERALLILFPPFYSTSFEVQGRLLIDKPPAETRPESGAGARGRD